MAEFTLPADLIFNRRPVDDPISFARETGSASWLFLVGDEFASMPGACRTHRFSKQSLIARAS